MFACCSCDVNTTWFSNENMVTAYLTYIDTDSAVLQNSSVLLCFGQLCLDIPHCKIGLKAVKIIPGNSI